MNQKIVNNSVKNFGKNIQINSPVFQESCERLLWKSIRETRKVDPFLYEEMCDLPTLSQTQLLESRLAMEVVEIDDVIESVGNAVGRALERALELNEDLGEEYAEEQTKSIIEDMVMFLQEDTIFQEDIKSWGIEKGQAFLKWLAGTFLSAIPAGVGTVGAYLTNKLGSSTSLLSSLLPSDVFLISCLVFIILYVISCFLFHQKGINISKEIANSFRGFVSVLVTIAKFVKNHGENYINKFNMTFKNEEKCYRKAGLDPNKLGLRHLMSMKVESFFNAFITADTADRLEILRNCFLETYLDRISIFFDLYFDCLKKTGNWNEVRSMSDDKFISMFRMKGGLYPMCDQFRDAAVKAINSYQDIVEHVFQNKPNKKSQWMLLLNRYILDKKNSQDEIKREFNNKQKKPTFTNDRFKKLAAGTDPNTVKTYEYDPVSKTKD